MILSVVIFLNRKDVIGKRIPIFFNKYTIPQIKNYVYIFLFDLEKVGELLRDLREILEDTIDIGI